MADKYSGIRLQRDGDVLAVKLIGLQGPQFHDALMKVKTIPGRRWNPDQKRWELPNDPETMMRAVHTLQPDMDAEVQAQVRTAQYAIADELLSALPDDGNVSVPWGDRLYRFQRAMVEFAAEHKKVLICDDMGLGKTLEAQTTVYEVLLRAGKWSGSSDRVPTLVVAANSNLGKWVEEYEKWVGEHQFTFPNAVRPMEPVIIDGKTHRKRVSQLEAGVEGSGIVITNWEKLPEGRKQPLLPHLLEVPWEAIIADEIHRAKNKDAQQTQALHKLRAPMQLGLTGTPVMTNPADLWSLLHWLDDVTYSSYWRFFNEFAESYAGYRGVPVTIGVKSPDKLRYQIATRLGRRTKSQVGIELPDKTRVFIEVPMKPGQRKMYEKAEKDLFIEVKRAVDAGDFDFETFEARIEAGEVESAVKMLPDGGATFSALRQIAVSPALLGEKDESGILDWMTETIRDNPGKQFVVWGWHRGTAELAAHRLRKLKPSVVAEPYHGGQDRKVRDELLKRFQNGDIQVLCCTIKAGGVGSDMQNSDTSIFLERSSVPSDNDQAEDRQHRIGQVNAVTVYVVGSEDTVQTGRIADLNRLREGMNHAIFGRPRE